MYHTITLTSAMWGYLYQLYDLHHTPNKEDASTLNPYGNGHSFTTVGPDWGEPGQAATYGRARPWRRKDTRVDWKDADPSTDDEDSLIDIWARRENGRMGNGLGDYYVALSEGVRNGQQLLSTSVKASSFYAERLFAWGRDDNNNPLERSVVLKHLKAAGMTKTMPNYWDPCLVWHGYGKGLPTFHEAVRADTDMGPTWYDFTQQGLNNPQHPAYSWEVTYGMTHHTMLMVNLAKLKEVAV